MKLYGTFCPLSVESLSFQTTHIVTKECGNMANPYLSQDESIILATQNIVVRSVTVAAILTNKRILLVEGKENRLQADEILLSNIRHVEADENAIRAPILKLSFVTDTGEIKQVTLTFSQKQGEKRKRECDDWVSKLKERVLQPKNEGILSGIPSYAQEPVIRAEVEPPSKIEIVKATQPSIDVSIPLPKPVETTTLPEGSFCTRCGNRVPPESTFCNKCGATIVPLGKEVPVPEPVLGTVQVPESPLYVPPTETKDRPIDKQIQTIEPLIADSTPRTVPAPAVSPKNADQPTDSAVAWAAAESAVNKVPGTATPGEIVAKHGRLAGLSYPDLPPLPGYPAPNRRKKMIGLVALILIVLAVIGGAFYYTQVMHGKPVTPPEPSPTPIITTIVTTISTTPPHPVPTVTVSTPPPTPQVLIPQTGVWARVQYAGKFAGDVGEVGKSQDVSGTGDQFYQIPTVNGTVGVSITKQDGSGDLLTVSVYKEGALVKQDITTAPHGEVYFQVALQPPTPTPTLKPTIVIPTTTTPIVNQTANQTGRTNTTG